jgi:hypothetical protein
MDEFDARLAAKLQRRPIGRTRARRAMTGEKDTLGFHTAAPSAPGIPLGLCFPHSDEQVDEEGDNEREHQRNDILGTVILEDRQCRTAIELIFHGRTPPKSFR